MRDAKGRNNGLGGNPGQSRRDDEPAIRHGRPNVWVAIMSTRAVRSYGDDIERGKRGW